MQDDFLYLDDLEHLDASDPSSFSRIANAIEQRLAWWHEKHEQDRLDRYRSISSI